MATLSATSGTPDWQVSQYQARLQQARRQAGQAEEVVRRLELQTEQARSEAMRSEDKVRRIERQAPEGHEARQPSIVNTQGQVTGRVLSLLA